MTTTKQEVIEALRDVLAAYKSDAIICPGMPVAMSWETNSRSLHRAYEILGTPDQRYLPRPKDGTP